MAKRRKIDMSGPTNHNYFLVKFEDNYADEFDVYGFRIMNEKQLTKFTNVVRDLKNFPLEIYFGTNEALIFESQKDVMSGFKMLPITKDEMVSLKRLFPNAEKWGYGFFPSLEDYTDEY